MKPVCPIDGCERRHKSAQHYEILRIASKPKCKNGCDKPQVTAIHGLCRNCYVKELPYAENSKLKKYNLTVDDYQRMSKEQNDVCLICFSNNAMSRHKTPMKLAVDHDHETGLVRGLLCGDCNLGLGKFKDRVDLLQNAINYLRKGNNESITK